CGACGLAGCHQLALAVADGRADAMACPVGGNELAQKIAAVLGVEVEEQEEMVAVVRCQGSPDKSPDRFEYQGFETCAAAHLVGGGHKACDWGCLGFGDCVVACPFEAMAMGENRLPIVLDDKCTACGKCVEACPRDIMELIPRKANIFIACMNPNRGKDVKQVCSVGCTGCTLCANPKNTPSGMIRMEEYLPVFDYSIEDDPVVAVYKCPTDSLVDKLAGKRPVFYISETKCTGAGECAKVCPVKGCIEQLENGKYVIHAEQCIGCGLCEPVCPSDAISVMGALGYQGGAEEMEAAVRAPEASESVQGL
ncbi:MAG TPA: 4Fe-4S dicluster domain-containing protein, partial [Bacteroidetes bacterium]|nr:4Fe-4S dicluster domain-containing protein [Bacteroidota bacterium]